jgi:hypothetical protein
VNVVLIDVALLAPLLSDPSIAPRAQERRRLIAIGQLRPQHVRPDAETARCSVEIAPSERRDNAQICLSFHAPPLSLAFLDGRASPRTPAQPSAAKCEHCMSSPKFDQSCKSLLDLGKLSAHQAGWLKL